MLCSGKAILDEMNPINDEDKNHDNENNKAGLLKLPKFNVTQMFPAARISLHGYQTTCLTITINLIKFYFSHIYFTPRFF